MKQNFKRKLLAGLLSVCMMFQTVGTVPVYAAGNAADSSLPIGTSSVCTHHVHDENCGYTEGTPCTHEHKVNGTAGDREDPLGDKDGCYTEVTKCVHEHTDECYPAQDSSEATDSDAKEPTECTHICDEESGCIAKELACQHVHDNACGYVEGTPCTFDTATCESCKAKNTADADNIVTFAGEEVYAVYEGSTFYVATADAPSTATSEKITDKNTINHLYIMGASVPKELMFQSTTLLSVAMPNVTAIGTRAFQGCKNLTSVEMPSVITIGFQAFDGCTGLASVEMSSATKIDGFAFASCTSLTSVAMPDVTSIGNNAFSGCTSLTSAQLPKVTTIGNNAFSNCIMLASVEMPSATSIGNMAFSNCQKLASLTFGETPPTVAAADAFTGCPASRTLTIPGSIDSQAVAVAAYKAVTDGNVTDDLWYGWTLPSITPSAGTLEITAGNSNPALGVENTITLTATFDKATNIGKQKALIINKVEFKDGTTVLGDVKATQNANGKWVATLNVNTKNWAVGDHNLTATFAGNEELVGSTTKEVTVTVNEVYAVYNGSKFCAATVDAPTVPTTTEITDKNTINHLYIMGESVPQNLMVNCTNLKTVNCADTVTTIDIYAFKECTSLTSVEMPAVITINIYAFYGCTKLTRAAIPSATNIGGRAFYDCTSLTSVEMPAVTTIGEYAFFNCTTLASLTLGATPPTVGTSAFNNCPTPHTLTIQGNTADQTAVLANYKAAADGDTTDDKWWGWTLPTSLDGTGLLNSAGTLAVTMGNSNPTVGTDNTITLTATFDKAAKVGKQRALAINEVEFKNGATSLGTATATATQNTNGKWVATLNVNTKDWTVGTHKLTAEYAGNHELGGSTTNEVTVTVNANEVYAVYDGSKFWRATQADPTTATSEEISSTDKTTITNLYIKCASVPNALMGDAGISPNTTLKTVTCANTVTSIGDRAFYRCRALTSVEMPNVNTIGAYAFYECKGLESVELPNAISIGINAFSYCTSLTSAKLPQVTSISDAAFDGCTKLANVAMPGATSIGKNAFLNCTSLISAKMPKAISISDFAFRNCTSLTSVEMSSATTIGFHAFLSCTALTSVAMPDVTEIGEWAFFGCTKLASVEMPKVTTIGDKAFYGTALTSVSLPSVTTIGINAFEGCTGLTSVEMPKVTKIVSYAFNGCTGLASLTLGATPPATVSTDAFTGCPTSRTLTIQCNPDSQADAVAKYKAVEDGNIEDNLWHGWTLPETINEVYAVYDGSKFCTATKADPTTATSEEIIDKKTINHLHIKGEIAPQSLMYDWKRTENTTLKTVTCANTVTTIGNDAFYDCKSLTSANLPKATSIGEQAFSGCTSLASVEMSSATTIGNDAFFCCTSLASVEMSSATTIGDRAFKGCISLASVEMPNVTTIGNSAFNTCTGLTSVVLPKVETISDDAFSGCIKLAIVSLPEATSINKAAFSNCTELTRAQLPKVTSIGTYAFYNCAKLASVEMSKVTSIGEQAFYGCASLTSVEMPSATTIAFQAFYGCAKLASVQLPKVTSIREKAFYGCESLESISLPEATSLDNRVFSGCIALTSAQLPKVTTIGLQAFYNCTSLASLTLGVTPPTVDTEAFAGSPKTNGLTIQGNTDYQDTVLADYKAVADGETNDDKWYGWTLPTSLNDTGVSTSEGKLTAAGSVTVNYGTDNTITFTASFAKVGENKLRALAENNISLLKGGVAVDSKVAILTDGVYSAEFTVQTKDLAAGNYNYTATFDGNRNLVGGTATETVTVTINKIDQAALNISDVPNKTYGDSNFTLSTTGGSSTGAVTYAVTAGNAVSVVESTGVVTVLKAGTATITATKAGDTNYNAKTGTVEITVQGATPTVTWGTTEQSTTYTGSPVLASVLTAPTVTLVNGEVFNGTIQYAYKYVGGLTRGLFADYTDGLPTNAGKYEIKAYVAADGNYAAGESTNSMTLTVNKSTPTLAISTMNGKAYDGTAATNPTAENMTISGTNYADVTFAYSKNSDMSKPLANAPKNAGTYYVQASVVAGDNTNAASSPAVSFTITKESASGISQEYPVVKTLAKDYSFDLSKLLPSISSTQEYGNVTYAVASTSNANSVLTAVPTNSDIVNSKLTLKVASVATKDQTATVTISITTDNFTVTNAVITVKTVDKIPLTISNVTMAERVYNGSAYAYTGTPTFTNTTDNKAVTGVSFTKEYEGRNTTSCTKSETAPTNAGEYNLILTVSGASAETYASTLTVPFAITQKEVTVKAKDKDILAGAEIPSLTIPVLDTDYTVAGFIETDTLGGTVSMSYTGTPDNTQHGSYPITISGGTASDNYTVNYENGTLTISIDVSLITAAITAADNAKGGIAIYDTTASSVAYGTKFVTTAEMSTLNTAIQTATNAKASCTTLAQVQAAAKALDDAVADFKAAIKTGTYTAPSGGGDSSGGSSGSGSDSGSGGSVVIIPSTPTAKAPMPPTKSEINAPATVDNNGNASITVTDQTVADAIKKAQDEAKKNGTEKNGISVELNVETGKKAPNSISANLPKAVQDSLVEGKVSEFKIVSEAANLTFDSKTLQEIQKQAGGDATIHASKADVSKLSKEARDEIGNRPVFNLSITGKDGKNISDFGGGSVTVSIPYTLQPDENSNNLQAYFIDAQGKLHEVACTYDPVTKCMVFVTNHFSTYGIGYKANAPKFSDIEKHWAKNDIEFVTAKGLLSGTSANTFSPDSSVTTRDFAAALTKLSGKDVSTIVENSNKDAVISRQEIAVIMQNFAKLTNYNLPQTRGEIKFSDTKNDAVKSMQMAGVIMGKDGNRFDPTATATRAEASAVLRRYVELVIDKTTAQGLDVNDSGKIVYYENGKLFTGVKTIDGTTYHFGDDGICTKMDAMISDTKKYIVHKVVRGDTLWNIAMKNKCTVGEIVGLNGIKNPNNVPIGTELKIPQK